ncbi:uncharacterized protein LOC111212736 [Brassica napus]|uniref:uncharacterized protein LOC111212736 n=1 Tax=Brassica napus TaxID=3708 RepID=UPI000BBEE823|nr:uncharacterized protein LOC111212736 [Brassica napus]
MVMAAEIDVSMSVRVFEELTFTKAEPHGIFSVKMCFSYNVLTGHPNKTKDWQRSYFYIKSDEHAFTEPPGDDYRVLWNKTLVRHPNTIAYPKKFFESAQAIVAHSHLSWPDLSREWIRRQEARIARAELVDLSPRIDWESRLPVVLGPRKSRLSLFTRKQQKLLDQARKMDGVPDLSALLKGKLQLLSKKSTRANVPGSTSSNGGGASECGGASKERASSLVDEGVGVEPSASSLEARKKKGGKKRPLSIKTRRRQEGEKALQRISSRQTRPRRCLRIVQKKKKKSVEAEPRPSAVEATLVDVATRGSVSPKTPLEKKREVSMRGSGSGSEPAASERSALDPSARKGSVLKCADLTRQIRGGTKELPPIGDLYFKVEYVDAAFARARSDGSMNFLVEKYDSTLKQTMVQLGASEKLAQARLKAIERVTTEHKKANEKDAKEKKVLRVKFEELEGKLKSDRAAKKELTREKARLEQAVATLEKEKAELLEERDAAVKKLIKERQRLKDSRNLEVTRETERVEAAMTGKANRCFGRVRDYLVRLDALGKAKSLYGQASGMKKCLEMIRGSWTEIPQEMIDVFAEQEKLHEAEAANLRVTPQSDSDLALSPLFIPPRFVEERSKSSFDPYGSNVDLIGSEMASQLHTSCEVVEDQSGEPVVGVTSAPAEKADAPGEENHEKDNPETRDALVQEERAENVSLQDLVLVSDNSSEGQ